MMPTTIIQQRNRVVVQNVPIQFDLLDAAIDTRRILHINLKSRLAYAIRDLIP